MNLKSIFVLTLMTGMSLIGCRGTSEQPSAVDREPDEPDKGVVLEGLGSVVDVITGRPDNARRSIDLSNYQGGFEAGSPRDVQSIGEFISFNGVGYTRSTAQQDRGRLLQGGKVLTNGAVFLRNDAQPALTVDIEQPISLAEWCDRMANQAQRPICYSGIVEFELMEATAITAAPVNSENIFENREQYYADGNWKKSDVRVAIFGCAANFATTPPELIKQLGVVLYQNPNETTRSLVIHTHGLELSSDIQDVDQLTPNIAINVHHIFNQSVIKRGKLNVFFVDQVKPIR